MSTLVSFERVAPSNEVTDAYKNLWNAVSQAREMCEAKCISIVSDANESNSQVVYALAGLRLSGFEANQFQNLLQAASRRNGAVEYSSGGSNRQQMSMSEVPALFNNRYRSRSDFRSPTDPAPNPDRGIAVPGTRAAAPAHRQPTCDRGHRMQAQLLHVAAFCDNCKMPLAEYVPCWTCEACDNDLCWGCTIIKFAPQVLAGGAVGPVPVNRPNPVLPVVQPRPVPQPVLRAHQHGAIAPA